MLLRVLSVRHWLRRPVRVGMTVLGIALGVAVTVAVDLVSNEIVASHRRTIEAVSGKAQLTVSMGEAGMPTEMAERIAAVPGVAHVSPLLEQTLTEPGKGPVMLLGVDFLGDDALRPIDAVPDDEEVLDDPLAFLNSTDSVLVANSFAARRGLVRGGRITLATPLGRKEFVVRGLLQDRGPTRALGGDVLVMYLDAAQIALGLGDSITQVDLSAKPGVDLEQLKSALRAALGPGAKVEVPAQRSSRMEDLMVGLRHALFTMVALALWVGILLAYNAMEISVRQRKGELAILRAVGAERSRIVSLVLLEAVVLGCIATPIGWLLGWGLAARGVEITAQLVSELIAVVKVDEITLGPRHIVAGLVVGIIIPLLGALRPAWWIVTQSPIAGLTQAVEEIGIKPHRRSLWLGLVITAVGLMVFASPAASARAVLGYTGFALTLLGAVFLAPAIVSVIAGALQRFGRDRFSAESIVALDHVIRDRRRAALNVASLVAGVATVITVATYSRSFSGANRHWLDSTLVSDLFVTSGSKVAMGKNTPMQPELGDELAKLPEVDRLYRVRIIDIDHRGRPLKLVVLGGIDDYLTRSHLLVVSGRLDGPALERGEEILVSENVARREGYKPGDMVELETPSGPRRFKLAGAIIHFISDQGVIFLGRETYQQLFHDKLVDSFDMILKPGTDVQAMQTKIRDTYGEKYNLFVMSNRELKDESQRLINQVITLLDFLQLVTLLIAVLGVSTTLISAVLDRTREVGVMRAVGTERAQIVRIVLAEAGFIGGSAALFGVLLGTAVGALFLRSVVVATVGWSMPWVVPLSAYPMVLIGVVLASVIAGLYPALWSARQPTLEAIRAE